MSGVGNTDSSITAAMLASRFTDSKYKETRAAMTEALKDQNLDQNDVQNVKEKFIQEFKSLNKGADDKTASEAFYKNLSSLVGKDTDSLKSTYEPQAEGANKKADTEPVVFRFKDLGDNNIAVDDDEIATNGYNSITVGEEQEVSDNRDKKGNFDYKSSDAKVFTSAVKNNLSEESIVKGNSAIIKADKEIYDGGSLNKIIENMNLPEDITIPAKVPNGGSQEVQKLQSFLGLPSSRQDGKFGAETMNQLKKQYAEALRSGDKDKVDKLSSLVGSLNATINNNSIVDSTLSKLDDTGKKYLKNTQKGEEKKYLEVEGSKMAKEAIDSLSSNPPDYKKFEEVRKQIETDPKFGDVKGKILEMMSSISTKKLADNIGSPPKKNLVGSELIDAVNSSANKDSKAISDTFKMMYKKGNDNNWTLNPDKKALSDFSKTDSFNALPMSMQNNINKILGNPTRDESERLPVGNLAPALKSQRASRAGEYLDSININSSDRAKAVKASYTAMYAPRSADNNAIWEYKPNKDNLASVLNDKNINSALSAEELNGMVKAYKNSGASDDDMTKVLSSLPKDKAAKILYLSSQNKDGTDQAAKYLGKMSKEDAAAIISVIPRPKEAGDLMVALDRSMDKKQIADLLKSVSPEMRDNIIKYTNANFRAWTDEIKKNM